MSIDVITRESLQYFVYAVAATIAEVERSQRPVQPRALREALLQQMLAIEERADLARKDVSGLADLRRRMVQLADDPGVRDRFDT